MGHIKSQTISEQVGQEEMNYFRYSKDKGVKV